MRLNLILCIMWLAVGAGLLGYRQLHPEIAGTPTENVALWGGCLGMLLALYNLVRWWASRTFARYRARREPQSTRRLKAATLEYNPEFDFTGNGHQTPGPIDLPGKE